MDSKPRFSKAHLVILAVQGILVVAFVIAGFVQASASADGWEGLMLIVVLMIGAVSVAAIAASAAIARLTMSGMWTRTATLLAGPAVFLAGLVVAVRA